MIEALKNIGFIVTERLERKDLSSDLQNRYSELPADYQEFLQRFQTITNESDNVWFNSIEDFNGGIPAVPFIIPAHKAEQSGIPLELEACL